MKHLRLGLLFLMACQTNSGSALQTSVPLDKPVNALTQAQAVTLCEDFERLIFEELDPQRITKNGCALEAQEAQDAAACQLRLQRCIDDPAPKGFDCSRVNIADSSGCGINVERWTSCIGGVFRYYDQVTPSCSNAGAPQMMPKQLEQDCAGTDFEACVEFIFDVTDG